MDECAMREFEVTFVRHGETDWNRQKLLQGQIDIPLNEAGRMQAKLLAAHFRSTSFSAVYASDLSRAYETAKILVAEQKLPVLPDSRLRERHYGPWEGKSSAEYKSALDTPESSEESPSAVLQRMLEFFKDLATRHLDGNVLVVSHGGAIRQLIGHLFNFSSEEIFIANVGFCTLRPVGFKWVLQDQNGIDWPTQLK